MDLNETMESSNNMTEKQTELLEENSTENVDQNLEQIENGTGHEVPEAMSYNFESVQDVHCVQSHVPALSKAMLKLQQNGKLCNVLLMGKDCCIRAHSVVLVSACPKFSTGILNFTKDLPSPCCCISLQRLELNELQSLVHYMYTGEVLLRPDSVKILRDTFNQLELFEAAKICNDYIKRICSETTGHSEEICSPQDSEQNKDSNNQHNNKEQDKNVESQYTVSDSSGDAPVSSELPVKTTKIDSELENTLDSKECNPLPILFAPINQAQLLIYDHDDFNAVFVHRDTELGPKKRKYTRKPKSSSIEVGPDVQPPVKKPRGRPRKNPELPVERKGPNIRISKHKPKSAGKPRGRPRKSALPKPQTENVDPDESLSREEEIEEGETTTAKNNEEKQKSVEQDEFPNVAIKTEYNSDTEAEEEAEQDNYTDAPSEKSDLEPNSEVDAPRKNGRKRRPGVSSKRGAASHRTCRRCHVNFATPEECTEHRKQCRIKESPNPNSLICHRCGDEFPTPMEKTIHSKYCREVPEGSSSMEGIPETDPENDKSTSGPEEEHDQQGSSQVDHQQGSSLVDQNHELSKSGDNPDHVDDHDGGDDYDDENNPDYDGSTDNEYDQDIDQGKVDPPPAKKSKTEAKSGYEQMFLQFALGNAEDKTPAKYKKKDKPM